MGVEIDYQDVPTYRTLQSLINFSDGLYTKPAHYFMMFQQCAAYSGTSAESEQFFGIPFDEDKERLISVSGILSWADYGSRSKIPYHMYYIIDEHGVKAKYKLGGKGNLRDGWGPVKEKTKLVWERTVEVPERSRFAVEDEEKQRVIAEQRAISKHVGAVKDKLEFEAEVLFSKEIPNEFGVTTLYIFKDDQDNKFKTFYSGHAWEAAKGDRVLLKGTVKGHDDYKGEKSTDLTRVKAKVLDPDA